MPSSSPIRLVATVTVPPELADEGVARARDMLTRAPEVLTAEVGRQRDVKTGEVVAGGYVLSLTFPDHAALVRYATSPPHDEVHAWVAPYLLDEHVAVFDAVPVPRP